MGDSALSSLAGEPLHRQVEALLVTTDRALSASRIAALVELPDEGTAAKKIGAAVEHLNAAYEAEGRAFRIEAVAGGWRVLTLPRFGLLMERLHGEREQAKLSRAALETLAIVAYRQPVLRAELEAIRGVACGEVLKTLLERRLVKVTGRAEIVGRPMQYGTTREFLQVFGLSSLDDLPKAGLGQAR